MKIQKILIVAITSITIGSNLQINGIPTMSHSHSSPTKSAFEAKGMGAKSSKSKNTALAAGAAEMAKSSSNDSSGNSGNSSTSTPGTGTTPTTPTVPTTPTMPTAQAVTTPATPADSSVPTTNQNNSANNISTPAQPSQDTPPVPTQETTPSQPTQDTTNQTKTDGDQTEKTETAPQEEQPNNSEVIVSTTTDISKNDEKILETLQILNDHDTKTTELLTNDAMSQLFNNFVEFKNFIVAHFTKDKLLALCTQFINQIYATEHVVTLKTSTKSNALPIQQNSESQESDEQREVNVYEHSIIEQEQMPENKSQDNNDISMLYENNQ